MAVVALPMSCLCTHPRNEGEKESFVLYLLSLSNFMQNVDDRCSLYFLCARILINWAWFSADVHFCKGSYCGFICKSDLRTPQMKIWTIFLSSYFSWLVQLFILFFCWLDLLLGRDYPWLLSVYNHCAAIGSTATSFTVLRQTYGRHNSKLGTKQQGQVHPKFEQIQEWTPCCIAFVRPSIINEFWDNCKSSSTSPSP